MATTGYRSSVFRDPDLNNRLLSILNEQRATSRFCDVVLKVRDEHIFAHSNVLAAASPYFGTLLGLGSDSPRAFCEKSPQIIEIQIDQGEAGAAYVDAVHHVVEYMYTSTLELNSAIITNIAEIASIMQMQRVIDYCDRFFKGETGVILPDKRGVGINVPDLGPSKRVKKANASTETELSLFQKSSGLSIEDLQKEFILATRVLTGNVLAPVSSANESGNTLHTTVVQKLSSSLNENISPTQTVEKPIEKEPENLLVQTVLNLSSVSAAQTKSEDPLHPESKFVQISEVDESDLPCSYLEDTPNIVMVKGPDGILTAALAVPFVSVSLSEAGITNADLVKQEPFNDTTPTSSTADSSEICTSQITGKQKPYSTRGRKRGRPCGRGRGRKQRVREVLSESDPELIEELNGKVSDSHEGEYLAIEKLVEGTQTEEEKDKTSSISDVTSSQDQPSATSSMTETSLSAESGEVRVKEEETVKMTRTRGRKAITSMMASWTSPRQRAGIPRSLFRSDYIMHSLIRRSRHNPISRSFKEEAFDDYDDENDEEACEAYVKSIGDTSVGVESTIKFVCQTCDFTTGIFRLYRQHMKCHPETDTRFYSCTECNFHTTKARQLLQHRKKHLHEDLICSYCDIQLDTAENFELHLQRHTHVLPYFCHSCDMRFKTRTQLNTHLPKHQTDKPFVCQICGNGFKWKHALKSHMVTHSATKDHLCDICGFATAHKSQLKAHHLIHTGNTFKCPEPGCPFEATKRQNLKYHMVTHTQEKPHQCEVCGQAFSLVKNMRRHMLLHNDTRPYHCSVCSYTTTRYDKLKEHKLKQHNLGHPPDKKAKYGEPRPQGTITVADDGTLIRSTNLQGFQMLPMEPITISQDGTKITISSDMTLSDEALQTIAQLATSTVDNVVGSAELRETQINISTPEGIPIIARVQFTPGVLAADPTEMISYITEVQE